MAPFISLRELIVGQTTSQIIGETHRQIELQLTREQATTQTSTGTEIPILLLKNWFGISVVTPEH